MEISDKNTQDLQLLQDAFAGMVKLSLVLTDSKGVCITEPSSPPDHQAFSEKEILQLFAAGAAEFNKTDSIFIVDSPYSPIQGVKCILAPFSLSDKVYFLWAGPFLTAGSFIQLSPEQQHYKEGLEGLAEFPPEEMSKLLQIIEEIRKYLQKVVDSDFKQSLMQQQYRFIENLVSGLEKHHFFHEAADLFLKNNPEMSFIGCAIKQDAYQYKISELYGNFNEQLLEKTFLAGEGFLGQAASSGQFLIWNNLKDDTRASIFSKNYLILRSLFCFHLKHEDTIVFGGSFQMSLDEEQSRLLRIMCSIFHLYKKQRQLRQELSISQTRLNILKDISMILSDIKDVNRVLYILMDLSINLVKGRFTCVYLHQTGPAGQSKMVSRGLQSDQISSYGSLLKRKYFKEDEADFQKNAALIQTPWKETAFECPLLQDDEVIGVFSVAMEDEREYEEFSPLLTSFAQLAGFSLRLLLPKTENEGLNERIQTLYQAVGEFDESAFRRISDAKDLLEGFLSFMGAEDKTRQLCGQAILLTAYRAEFLAKQNFSKKIVHVIEEYYLIEETRPEEPFSWESQIIYLVLKYLGDVRKNKPVFPESIDPGLISRFEAFLLKTEAKETILPDDPWSVVPAAQPNFKGIKSQFHLSEREEEVLDLMIKGRNNKEIGDQLYISEHTVKNHLTNIFRKLNVKDRTHAIAKCYSWGRFSS